MHETMLEIRIPVNRGSFPEASRSSDSWRVMSIFTFEFFLGQLWRVRSVAAAGVISSERSGVVAFIGTSIQEP